MHSRRGPTRNVMRVGKSVENSASTSSPPPPTSPPRFCLACEFKHVRVRSLARGKTRARALLHTS